MSNLIKVAVIGAGMMGKNHLRTYKSLPGVELVGVYDIFGENAKKAAEMFGIKADGKTSGYNRRRMPAAD